jgi:hypothetical protein
MQTRLKAAPSVTHGRAANVEGNKCEEMRTQNAALYARLNGRSGSARAYYEKQSPVEWPKTCTVVDCRNDATDGAHIFKVATPSTGTHVVDEQHVFILPTCHAHNMKRSHYDYVGHPVLICTLSDAELVVLRTMAVAPRRSRRLAEKKAAADAAAAELKATAAKAAKAIERALEAAKVDGATESESCDTTTTPTPAPPPPDKPSRKQRRPRTRCGAPTKKTGNPPCKNYRSTRPHHKAECV